MANYVVVALRSAGPTRQMERTFKGAPSESRIVEWLRSARHGEGFLDQWEFAVRYYPSRKGWLVLDVRSAFKFGEVGAIRFWKGVKRSKRVFPNEAAAVMYAQHIIQREQAQLTLV